MFEKSQLGKKNSVSPSIVRFLKPFVLFCGKLSMIDISQPNLRDFNIFKKKKNLERKQIINYLGFFF